ncbi:hypothetical protein FVB13_08040 [Escherichia coli]|uniref:hypothetical protein n=1 Tax=Escherichia coli TaxID=562 RepID=UPI00128AF9F7|nr:hypothetical protein [Escherichia coli]MPU29099.1 hypothetical protein [Escherichia coli]MPU39494.1 hypothetical protein [Escherichia coli]
MTMINDEVILLTAIRDCIKLRKALNANGLSDHDGALSSIEHLLELLSMRRKYSSADKNVLKASLMIERTIGVSDAIALGKEVRVENVHSRRDWTLMFVDKVNMGWNDNELLKFIDDNYRIILTTLLQSQALAKLSSSFSGMDRFDHIGLKIDTQNVATIHTSSTIH